MARNKVYVVEHPKDVFYVEVVTRKWCGWRFRTTKTQPDTEPVPNVGYSLFGPPLPSTKTKTYSSYAEAVVAAKYVLKSLAEKAYMQRNEIKRDAE